VKVDAFSVVLGCHVEDLLQPPIEIEHVTLSEGSPLNTSHLRTAAPPNTDLAELMTSMEHLREELVRTRTEAAKVEKSAKLAQMKLARVYQDLHAALRGRGMAEQAPQAHSGGGQ
jgi:hypothetical protein